MRVYITVELMSQPEWWDQLDQVFLTFLDERHVWDNDEIDEIKASPWYRRDGGYSLKRKQENLDKIAVRSIYTYATQLTHRNRITVATGKTTSMRVSVEDAPRLLMSPLKVVVENQESDGGFLRAMIAAFGRENIGKGLKRGWVRIEHGGGIGDIKNRLREMLQECPWGFRLFVMADSDAMAPGAVGEQAQALKAFCDGKGIRCVILSKRKIENYLPVAALAAVPDRAHVCQAFDKQLNEEQKDHFEMKGGFEKKADGTIRLKGNDPALFDALPQATKEALCGGFGPNVSSYFGIAHQVITEPNMRGRCTRSPAEIDDLLDSIETLI